MLENFPAMGVAPSSFLLERQKQPLKNEARILYRSAKAGIYTYQPM